MSTIKLLSFVLAGSLICGTPALVGQTTVFNDTFSSNDPVDPSSYTAPTPSSTSWYSIGSKTAAPVSVSSISNAINIASTSSGSVTEAAAVFSSTPVSLTNAGDYIQLAFTFSGSLVGSNGYILTGLFDSNASTPLAGPYKYGPARTGGFAGWTGYNGGIGIDASSSSSKIYARPAELDTVANNQDLIYGGLGTAYANPIQVGSSVTYKPTLVDNTMYTATFKISLDGSLASIVDYNLYTGATATGTPLVTVTGAQASGTQTTTFDSLALGFYNKGLTAGSSLDFKNIVVTTNVGSAIPEPSTYAALAGVFALGLAFWRRRHAF